MFRTSNIEAAVDNIGQSVLHHMFDSGPYRHCPQPNHTVFASRSKDYPSLVNQADNHGKTPLHMALRYAVLQRNTAPAEALFEAGADPSAVDEDRNTAIHILASDAVDNAQVRSIITNPLLGCLDFNARNSRGETPLFNLVRAIPFYYLHPVEFLYEEIVSLADALAIFQKLGAGLFAIDRQRRGLLHVAAEKDLAG
jgi:hypothetical protein